MTGFVVMTKETIHAIFIYSNEFPPDDTVFDISN